MSPAADGCDCCGAPATGHVGELAWCGRCASCVPRLGIMAEGCPRRETPAAAAAPLKSRILAIRERHREVRARRPRSAPAPIVAVAGAAPPPGVSVSSTWETFNGDVRRVSR